MDIYASALPPAVDIGTGCYLLVIGKKPRARLGDITVPRAARVIPCVGSGKKSARRAASEHTKLRTLKRKREKKNRKSSHDDVFKGKANVEDETFSNNYRWEVRNEHIEAGRFFTLRLS